MTDFFIFGKWLFASLFVIFGFWGFKNLKKFKWTLKFLFFGTASGLALIKPGDPINNAALVFFLGLTWMVAGGVFDFLKFLKIKFFNRNKNTNTNTNSEITSSSNLNLDIDPNSKFNLDTAIAMAKAKRNE